MTQEAQCQCTEERHEVSPLNLEVGERDRGSATLWGVALMGILMSVAMAFAVVASARVARHRVNAAADLSALAAAKLAIADPDEACRRAAIVAAENGAKLIKCQTNDEIADVWTSLTARLPFVGPRSLTGRSRAGPGREDQPVDQAESPSELATPELDQPGSLELDRLGPPEEAGEPR